MSSEIREAYLSYFEERGHMRRPSAPLVPSSHDPSVLLTTAGMQPLKPYFLGIEDPPAPRLTSCQRCFRTTDIEEVGNTARHLTYFEMLGNFAVGDYFKQEAIAFGWEFSLEHLGLDPERIWITVFGGDEELGLGPDTEAIEIWKGHGVPEERIVELPRSENFWQAGPTGPCGPCSELYYDRGEAFGGDDERPGDDSDRYLEYWNLVFMTYELGADGSLGELPKQSIDTGLGVERMAAIKQDVPSVYETDGFRPLVELAEELCGRSYGDDAKSTRAMRIISDHTRGMVQLISDGVVPSNEDRGYILRRIMRRAIHQGRVLGLEPPYLGRFAERAIKTGGDVHPQLVESRETIMRWVGDEEESFGRTLDRGTEMLAKLVAEAKESSTSWVDASEAFLLHDTYGFPYDLTKELLAEAGLSVDDDGFEELMDQQRERARTGAATATPDRHNAVISFVSGLPRTSFVGYETLAASTGVVGAGDGLVKLEESPFYPEGGGQVADSGKLRWNGTEAGVVDVYRVGDDQAVRVDADALPAEGERVEAVVDHATRHATMRNHTATHLLHAALRSRLGTHVRQAGSAVRPDKLRFDFTHGAPLDPDELADVEQMVNDWVKGSHAVRAIEMERVEAERLGAMALFGEKYGDWVRMVEVDEVSRELCGGTHVASSGEVGIFTIVSEGSSAANVRRIEALTGPAAIDWFRERSASLDEVGALLGSPRDPVAAAKRAAGRLAELEREASKAGAAQAGERVGELEGEAIEVGGVKVLAADGGTADQRELLVMADRLRSKLGDCAVVLGGAAGEKVGLVAMLSKPLVERGLSAAEIVREAAPIVGGGGGGRDDVAQAGGRDPEHLGDALAAAREAIERKLA
ncbi:MAG: alanine--tRNA ligase [Solirubrobacterales bacterium]